MHHFLSRLVLSVGVILGAAALRAQTTLNYTSAEDKTAALVLTGVNSPVTLQVNTGTATQSGNISESGGSFGFTKDGGGSLILTGANTFTGTTDVMAGTLQTGTTGALGTGVVNIEAAGLLNLTGGTHNLAGLSFNLLGGSTGANPFLVVSGGAVLTSSGAIGALYDGPTDDGILITGAGSRVVATALVGDRASFTLANGGTLQLTSSAQLGSFNIGGKVGEAAAAPGFLAVPSNVSGFFSSANFNHTATDYWFTSDGTATGTSVPFFGDYRISAGTTIFKNTSDTGGSLLITGGEASFTVPISTDFVTVTINSGGTAAFAANPFRPVDYAFHLNGGTFRATESFTILVNLTTRLFQTTGGTFSVDAGKTLTLATEHAPFGYDEVGQAVNGPGSFTKQGAGTLTLERDYMSFNVGVPDFTVRQGTLRTPSYVFDEVVIGQQAGDNGNFTLAPANVSLWSAGVPLSLGFMYANYWTPFMFAPPLLAEFDVSGSTQTSLYLVPAVQSRRLTLGEQSGSTGNLTLNEGTAGGWYVDNGLAVIGGAGTGHVTLVDHFLYNNGHDIVLGQSPGGLGTVTVTGSNAQLNAGVDLTPLDPFGYSGYVGETPAIDRGVGNIIIGQGGTGHLTVTNNARMLAAQTFIGAGSDLTLGSGGTIYGGFTAQNGSLVHATDGATFAYTLGATTEASAFEAGSAFTIDFGAQVFVDVTTASGFAPRTYGLFSFAGGTTLNGVNASNFVLRGQPGGYGYAFDLTGTDLNLVVTAIPEPSTYALLAGGAGLGVAILRRRKRMLRR